MNVNSNYYLYAKGWYKETDILEDLKIISNITNENDDETIDRIRTILAKIVKRYDYDNYGSNIHVTRYDSHRYGYMHKDSPFNKYASINYTNEYNPNMAIIYKLLTILCNIKLSDIKGGMARPDPSLLELSNN